jgi:hypothetical protein
MNESHEVHLKSPFTAIMAGPTGAGKTRALMNLIKRATFISNPPPEEIIYCYGEWQKTFEDTPNVRFHDGAIDPENDIPNDGKHRWLILDDLMNELGGKDQTNKLFTKNSHHRNISVFFIVQNLFKKEHRTMSLNTHYMFIFKNPRDKSSIEHFARQAFPGKVPFVREAFEDATSKPYSYLLLDMRQETNDKLRLIGNYGAGDGREIVYVPR